MSEQQSYGGFDNHSDFKKRICVPSQTDVNLAKSTEYIVYASPTQALYSTFQSNAATPSGNIQFNIPLNTSPSSILSKTMYLQYQMDVTLSRVANDATDGWSSTVGLIHNSNCDPLGISLAVPVTTAAEGAAAWNLAPAINGLQSWPIQRSAKNITVSLNNTAISTNTADFVPIYENLFDDDEILNSYASTCPVLKDSYPSYNGVFGKQKNPLLKYVDNTCDVESRASIKYVVLPTNRSRTSVTVRAYVTEPLSMVAPLATNPVDAASVGFLNISSLYLNINMTQNMGTVWSCNAVELPPSAVVFSEPPSNQYTSFSSPNYTTNPNINNKGPHPTSITYTFAQGSVQLLLTQYSAPDFSVIGGMYHYPFYETLINPGQPVTLTHDYQNINGPSYACGGVPHYIGIYLSPTELSAYQSSAQYGLINKASITFSNQSGILANCQSEQLFYLSQLSGSKQSWPEWSQYVGSILWLDVSKCLPLNNTMCVGMNGSFTLNVQLNAALNPLVKADDGSDIVSKSFNMQYVMLYEALFSVSADGNTYSSKNNISAQDWADVKVDALDNYVNSLSLSNGNVSGGSFYSSIRDRLRAFLKPRIVKLKAISDRFSPKILATLSQWDDVLPKKFSDGVRNVTESITEAINDADRMVGSGLPFAALMSFLLQKYGPQIWEKVKAYLQQKGIINASGSGFTSGGNIGMNTPVGGARRRLAM
jgi:hypothetical protein